MTCTISNGNKHQQGFLQEHSRKRIIIITTTAIGRVIPTIYYQLHSSATAAGTMLNDINICMYTFWWKFVLLTLQELFPSLVIRQYNLFNLFEFLKKIIFYFTFIHRDQILSRHFVYLSFCFLFCGCSVFELKLVWTLFRCQSDDTNEVSSIFNPSPLLTLLTHVAGWSIYHSFLRVKQHVKHKFQFINIKQH